MNLLVIHRRYRHKGGEDLFLETLLFPALKQINVKFDYMEFPSLFSAGFFTSLWELIGMFLGLEKLRPSFFKIKRQLQKNSYTHVLFNNFAPTLSLAAPLLCKRYGLKTFWWLHNARHSCANGLLFNGHSPCHKCLIQGSRHAFLQNCHSSKLQSFIYSVIYRNNRVPKQILKAIDVFIAPAQYTLQSLKHAFEHLFHLVPSAEVLRFPAKSELPQALSDMDLPPSFYLFLGRLSEEKGADLFVEIARKHPRSQFIMAGDGPLRKVLETKKPENVILVGQVNEAEKNALFSKASALILCSRVPENSPLVIFESQPWGLPVIYPKGGGAEEIVKYLKRSGCALEDFTGQRFEKTNVIVNDQFKTQLKDLFAQ